MIMAARGLGKGLDSLIPNTIGEAKEKKESKEIYQIHTARAAETAKAPDARKGFFCRGAASIRGPG